MDNFSLLKQLEAGEEPKTPASSIDYQQYELVVEGENRIVNIPKRESDAFESTVNNLTAKIDRPMMRQLLRTFRGTRG